MWGVQQVTNSAGGGGGVQQVTNSAGGGVQQVTNSAGGGGGTTSYKLCLWGYNIKPNIMPGTTHPDQRGCPTGTYSERKGLTKSEVEEHSEKAVSFHQ